MKVWIEILTPKQVMLFGLVAKELERKGHEVFITTRKYRETNSLLKEKGISAKLVGKHGGPTLEGKMLATLERMGFLHKIIIKEKPDVALSLCSPEAARICFGLGIKHACLDDIPEAEAQAKLTLPLADAVLAPKLIPKEIFLKYGISEEKLIQYDALDPRAWLYDFKPHKKILHELGISEDELNITFRTEEAYASYLNGSSNSSIVVPVINKMLEKFSDANFIVLPRYEKQECSLRQKFDGNIIIPKKAIDAQSLLCYSGIFIGGGGTMTLESALLGTPTIACRPLATMYENYVIEKGLAHRSLDVNEVVAESSEILRNNGSYKKQHAAAAKKMMEKMENPVDVIVKTVENFK